MSGLISNYINYLPKIFSENKNKIVTLNEGSTPLLYCNNLKNFLNLDLELYLKFEGTNPTGSFKDRGMTAAVTHAKLNNEFNKNIKAVICASTGNTSASASSYAARANLKSIVIIPEGKIASGKLVQAIATGSKIVQIKSNFDKAMELVKTLENNNEVAIVNSINKYRIEGQKTISFEVVDELKKAPDYHCLPVGNAGNITAHWLGYNNYYDDNIITAKPKMLGYQAEGAAPFLHNHPIKNPETIATAIRIGNPQSWQGAVNAVSSSNGWFASVSDQEILDMQSIIAKTEGIFCEPASAASVAGLYKDYQNNKIIKKSLVVCTLTGHGLKDPDIILNTSNYQKEVINMEPDLNTLRDLIN